MSHKPRVLPRSEGGTGLSAAGSSGNVLTSNGTDWTSSAPATKVGTVNGDSGSVTGATISLYARTGSATRAGSTVTFSGSGSEMDLFLVDGNDNLMLGRVAGNTGQTGFNNVGLGTGAMEDLTDGGSNTCVGYIAGNNMAGADNNTAIGRSALFTMVSNDNCTGIGYAALTLCTGSNNTAVGTNALNAVTSGTRNTALGYNAGTSYTGTESNNIVINASGTAAESNVMRIGTTGAGAGQVNQCFLAGTNTTVSGSLININSTDKLGQIAPSTANNVLTSDGTTWASAAPRSFALTMITGTDAGTVADATTYFMRNGQTFIGSTATAGIGGKLIIPIACTLVAVYGNVKISGTLASAGSCTVNVRLNNTTDTQVTNSLAFTAASNTFNNSALSVSCSAGDYLEIKVTTPTWVTNPTQASMECTLLFR